jgi:hypothetical protein
MQNLPTETKSVRTLVFTTAILYLVLSTVLNFLSKGFLEADGVTHYLYSRFAFQNPAYFADVWGRPVRMLIHAVPAHFFGLHGVRAASLVCVLITAWLVVRIAKKLDWRAPAYAAFFLLIQPLLFLHSFSELTEVPFALLGALAMLTLLHRQWWIFALICGAMPASRPEGAGFVLLAIAMLILHRKWYWLPLVAVPILIWNTYGWIMWGSDSGPWHLWLVHQFPYSAKSLYDAGPIYRFLAVLPFVVSPIAVPAILIGSWGLIGSTWGTHLEGAAPAAPFGASGTDSVQSTDVTVNRHPASQERRPPLVRVLFDLNTQTNLLIFAIPWGILAVHSYLHYSGKMSSSGEPRYLLAAAPFWALLAARGWPMIIDRFRVPKPALIAGLGALIPVAVDLTYPVVPLKPQPDATLCAEIAKWYQTSPYAKDYPIVYGTHPLVYLYTDRPIQDIKAKVIAHPPKGAFFVFDSMYASYNSDPERKVTQAMFDAAGWKKVETGFGLKDQVWQIYLSPESAATNDVNLHE